MWRCATIASDTVLSGSATQDGRNLRDDVVESCDKICILDAGLHEECGDFRCDLAAMCENKGGQALKRGLFSLTKRLAGLRYLSNPGSNFFIIIDCAEPGSSPKP